MRPPAWMQITPVEGDAGQFRLDLNRDVFHEDFLPDMCDHLRATGRRELIPALRLAHGQMIAQYNAQEHSDGDA